MKIDLHTHTKELKKSEKEAKTRREMPLNIESVSKFIKTRTEKNVGVVALTNHNYFDLEQFNLLASQKSGILFLPGAEINVLGLNGVDKHHCNIIVDNSKAEEFSKEFNIDDVEKFNMGIEEFLNLGKKYSPNCILLIETSSKGLGFSEKDIDDYIDKFCRENEIYYALEASNKKSASIISNHDRITIVGSDSDRWDVFSAGKLPVLNEREIDVEDTMTFKQVITELKNKRFLYGIKHTPTFHEIKVTPGEINNKWEREVQFQLREGLSIFVGPKASGKTLLLNEVYNELKSDESKKITCFSTDTNTALEKETYESIVKKISDKLKKEIIRFNSETEMEILISLLDNSRNITFSNIKTNFDNLIKFNTQEPDDIYSKMEEFTPSNVLWSPNEKVEIDSLITLNKENIKTLKKGIEIIESYDDINIQSKQNAIEEILKIISEIKANTMIRYKKYLTNKIQFDFLDNIKTLIAHKSNRVSKPQSLGLYNFWLSRKKIQNQITSIFSDDEKESSFSKLGNIIDSNNEKREIFLNCKNFIYETKKYSALKKSSLVYGSNEINESRLKPIFSSKKKIMKNIFISETSGEIKTFCDYLIKNKIKINELFITYMSFVDINKKIHIPSNGEQLFILISHILEDDSNDIYILDEPEKSLDNKLVSDYIVERIKTLKHRKKTILVITHNANIAINAEPNLVVYRRVSGEERHTFTCDNSSYIMRSNDTYEKIDWRDVAVSLLEGGNDALESRKEFYTDGKNK